MTRTVARPIRDDALAPVSQAPRGDSGEPGAPSLVASIRDLSSRVAGDVALKPGRGHQRSWVVVVTDLVSAVVALTIGLIIMAVISNAPSDSMAHFGDNVLATISFPVIAIPMLAIYGLYRRHHRRVRHSSFGDLEHLTHAMTITGIVTFAVSSLGNLVARLPEIAPAALVPIAICALVVIPAGRGFIWWLHARMLRAQKVAKEGASRVLIVGSGTVACRITDYLADDPTIDVVGCVDDNPPPGSPTLGRIADVPRICSDLRISRVLIGFSQTHPLEIIEQLRPVQDTVAISIVPRYFELLSWRSEMDEICGLPIIDVAPPQLNLMARLVKRSFDIVTAALGLIVMAPLLAMIVVMIKSSSAGPFIFTQQRIGRGGRPFTIYKFRTMNVNAENERESLNLSNDVGGPTFKMHVDPRTYAFGGFLRQLSLDEIPQLFNVLRGEMSLIGPRPFILSESEHLDGWASRRFDVRPGLSGLWQISGRNDLSFDELRRLDYVYVASWSFWWDLRILWHTPGSVWTRRGAY
jgi:exopolysaccharide biosynthesis polyprenyl glycosylphosphotransferase